MRWRASLPRGYGGMPPSEFFEEIRYSEINSGGFLGCLFSFVYEMGGQILRVSKLGLWVYVHESVKHMLRTCS